MDRENSEVKMEMRTRGAEMSEEARTAAVFSCEYSEQNPVYCQQCGGHEHLCRKRLNTEGLAAYFDQMATDGRVETTVQWLVEVSLLIQSDVEKRLKHAHAEHTGNVLCCHGNSERNIRLAHLHKPTLRIDLQNTVTCCIISKLRKRWD